jgi:hypothetical protein
MLGSGWYEKDPVAGWVNRPQLGPEKRDTPFTRPATLEEEQAAECMHPFSWRRGEAKPHDRLKL